MRLCQNSILVQPPFLFLIERQSHNFHKLGLHSFTKKLGLHSFTKKLGLHSFTKKLGLHSFTKFD